MFFAIGCCKDEKCNCKDEKCNCKDEKCKCKEEIETRDYRDKWIGIWDFFVKTHSWVGEYSKTDSTYYLGKISADSCNENKIIIEYLNDYLIILSVDEYGEFSNIPAREGNGKFLRTDSMYLHLRQGMIGMGSIHNIEGKKKKGGKNE